jgi:hypothetical protein
VYGVKKNELPLVGGGSNKEERERLVNAMESMIANPLPPKLPAPSPYTTRAPHSAPTEAATALEDAHRAKEALCLSNILARANHGVTFTAARARRASRAVTHNHIAMEGRTFIDEDVEWKVIDVRYSKAQKVMVVWYYDIEMAHEQGISEDDMITLRNDNSWKDCEPLECSSVDEVNTWIGASDSGGGGPSSNDDNGTINDEIGEDGSDDEGLEEGAGWTMEEENDAEDERRYSHREEVSAESDENDMSESE